MEQKRAEKRGEKTKILKGGGGKLGQGVGALKRGGGLEPPYRLYIKKCAMLVTERGKIVKSVDIELPDLIKSLQEG